MYSEFTSIIIYLIQNIKFIHFDVRSEIMNALSNTGLTEFNYNLLIICR